MILIVSAILVYASFYPDIPRIKQENEIPRQTGEGYQEPIVSNPQVAIIPPPTPSADNIIPLGEKTESGVLNTMAAASLVVHRGFGTYLLFRHRREVARYFFSIIIIFLVVVTSWFFADEVTDALEFATSIQMGHWLKLIITIIPPMSLAILAVKALIIAEEAKKMRKLIYVLTGIFAGSFMAAVVPTYIVISFSELIAL